MKIIPPKPIAVKPSRKPSAPKAFTFQWLTLQEPKETDHAGKEWTVKSKLTMTEHVLLSLLQNWEWRGNQMQKKFTQTYYAHGRVFTRQCVGFLKLRKISGYNHRTILKTLQSLFDRRIITDEGALHPAFAKRFCKPTKNGGFTYIGLTIPNPGHDFNFQVFRAYDDWHIVKVHTAEVKPIKSRTTYYMHVMGISRRTFWLWEKRLADERDAMLARELAV